MGNPVDEALHCLGLIFNTIQEVHDLVEDDYVRPLQQFPSQEVEELDLAHDHCVTAVQQAMGKLYGPGSTFEGAAADAIAELVGQYLDQEEKLSQYDTDEISQHIRDLESLCRTTVQRLEPDLSAIAGIQGSHTVINDLWHALQDSAGGNFQQALNDLNPFHDWGQIFGSPTVLQEGPQPTGTPNISTNHAQMAALLGGPGQIQIPQPEDPIVTYITEGIADVLAELAAATVVTWLVLEGIKQLGVMGHVFSISSTLRDWKNKIEDLANKIILDNIRSLLPGKPSGPPGSPTPKQVNSILDQLRKEGITLDAATVTNLLTLGYTSDQIIQMARQANALVARLAAAGIHTSINAVLALLVEGYTPTQIEYILKVGDLTTSEGKTFQRSPTFVATGHALHHVGLSDAAMQAAVRAGKRRETSFPDLATAQSAVNYVIANSPVLQNFIDHGAPDTEEWATICDTSASPRNFGYGYKRDTSSPGGIARIGPLHCVRVGLFKNASGQIYVYDAYPVER